MSKPSVPGVRRDAEPGATELRLLLDLKPGEYGKDIDGVWYCRPPWDHACGCLAKHAVHVHEDGTITAHPSIVISCGPRENPLYRWHGFLERGIWKECD